MGELAMAALARGGQLPVQVAPPRLHLALALGHLPALFAFLGLPPLVVVRRVIGPPLTIQVALQAPQRFDWLRGDLDSYGFWNPSFHYTRHTDSSLAGVRAYIRNQRIVGGLADILDAATGEGD
jgi:hypothetical protein